jgi:hypothetical protein
MYIRNCLIFSFEKSHIHLIEIYGNLGAACKNGFGTYKNYFFIKFEYLIFRIKIEERPNRQGNSTVGRAER